MPMISRKMMKIILCGNFEKRSSRMGKKGFKKDLPTLPSRIFFMFILLISNHTVFFSRSLGINLHL